MVVRNYSSVAQQTTLTAGILGGAATIDVAATAGFPTSYPYTLALDYGSAAEELVDVTSAAGLTLSVTRGVDGTSAQSHSNGAVVKHVATGRDFADSRTHENATSGVHGVTGSVVGTSDTQTLGSKTLTSPTINGGALSGTFTGTPTLNGAVVLSGTPSISAGAALAGTFTGTPTFNGNVVFSASPNFSGTPTIGNFTNATHTHQTSAQGGGLDATAALNAAWTTYTPTWTSAGTAPAIGNGTLTGRYVKIGNIVHVRFTMIAGGTTTFGSTNNWTFALPVAATTSAPTFFGAGLVKTGTVNKVVSVVGAVVGASTMSLDVASGFADGTAAADGFIDNATPAAYTTSASIVFSGTYEAA